MSVQAIAWVIENSTATGTDRLVLISLANHAGASTSDGAFESWPSVERIAREAGLARTRTAQDSLARLEAAGLVERIINGAPDDRIRADRRPNLYRVLVGVTSERTPSEATGCRLDVERGDAGASNGVTRDRATGCRDASPKPSVEPLDQPSVKPSTRARRDPLDGFDEFWTAYPRHDDKGRARRAWPAAVRRAHGVEPLLDGARRYAADPNRVDQYTKQAATWLNADSWENGALPVRRDTTVSSAASDWANANDFWDRDTGLAVVR